MPGPDGLRREPMPALSGGAAFATIHGSFRAQ